MRFQLVPWFSYCTTFCLQKFVQGIFTHSALCLIILEVELREIWQLLKPIIAVNHDQQMCVYTELSIKENWI